MEKKKKKNTFHFLPESFQLKLLALILSYCKKTDVRLIIAESRSSELCDLSLHIYKDVDKRNVAQKIKAVFLAF